MLFTILLAMLPAFSGAVVVAVFAPQSFSVSIPLVYALLVFAPALLELCGIVILVHSWVRRPGLAHALTMFIAFSLVLNEELSLVVYPPGQLGLPAPVGLSELVGWAPWLSMIGAMLAIKVCIFAFACALALLGLPRLSGVRSTGPIFEGWTRLRGTAGVCLATTIASLVCMTLVFERQLVESGQYVPQAARLAEDAAWEEQWLPRASRFSVEGGHAHAIVNPHERTVRSTWSLRGVRASSGLLHAELPDGVELAQARVNGASADIESSLGHAAVSLGACAQMGCDVELKVTAIWHGWPVGEEVPWIDPSGAWIRAQDILPRLGLDPDRRIRAPTERSAHGLPLDRPAVAPQAAVAELGVAPAASWTFTIEGPPGWSLSTQGASDGPLDFAAAWRPSSPESTEHDGVVAWHGSSHDDTAVEVLEDVAEMRSCLTALAGLEQPVHTVLQAPRGGTPALAAGVLWLPEDHGWDVASEGYGRTNRLFVIGRTMISTELVTRGRLRREPGSRWVVDGASGAFALRCVRKLRGEDGWQELLARRADDIVQALGAIVAPVDGLAADGDAAWVEMYAPAAALAWMHQLGFDTATRTLDEMLLSVHGGASVQEALAVTLGQPSAAEILGPPQASDLAVGPRELGTVEGKRWRWDEGGWVLVGPSTHVVVRRADETQVFPTPLSIDGDHAVVLDDWASFERSIQDNVWRASQSGPEPR